MAARSRISLERAVVERGRIPLGFLLQQLAQSWGVGLKRLGVDTIHPHAFRHACGVELL